jgi:phosphinothricin acetyltransferase
MEFVIEPMMEEHRTGVIDIFNYYISNSFAAYPEKKVSYSFYDQILVMCQGYPGVVAKDATDRIVGFGMLRPFHFASTFQRTGEISYFLHPDVMRQGLGTEILNHIVQEAGKTGIDSIVASISSLNVESLNFHKKHGFVERGRLESVAKKFGKDFDVVWMQKRLL